MPSTVLVLCFLFGLVASDYPFNDPTLSWNERVQDLVVRLTVDEMTLQIAMGGRTTHAPGIERLGIKPYPWGSECLRGDVQAGPATSFPQALGLAATFRYFLLKMQCSLTQFCEFVNSKLTCKTYNHVLLCFAALR